MKRLKLEDLEVESFVADPGQLERGTVRAHQETMEGECGEGTWWWSWCDTCAHTCGWKETCLASCYDQPSCRGYATCYNADGSPCNPDPYP